jgi:hypothetical protein
MGWVVVTITHRCPACKTLTRDVERIFMWRVTDITHNLKTKHCNFCDYTRSSGLRTEIIAVTMPVLDENGYNIFKEAKETMTK